MTEILDTNRNTFGHYDALKVAGVKTVIRYLAAGLESHEKVIKAGEARAIAAAGMRLGLVYEINGTPSGSLVGQRDGIAAKSQAMAVGAPADGSVILWYTVDWDAPVSAMPGIISAIRAFKAAVEPEFRVGAYASGGVCDELWTLKLIAGRWLTDSRGFRGTRDAMSAGRYELLQALPTTIAGLDTDPDAIHAPVDGKAVDIGDFVPFGAAPSTSAPALAPAPPQALAAPAPARMTGITATVFGGHADRNTSAYDGHVISDTELGVSLPARVPAPRPKVRVINGDKSVVADIVDVGPWNVNDPYWSTGARPQAESGIDKIGRRTNHAGIDLTPATARALGIDGMGKVDWEFA